MIDKENLKDIKENILPNQDDISFSDDEISENNQEEGKANENSDIKVDGFFSQYFPDFKDSMKGMSQEDVDKFQNWMREKMEKGLEYLGTNADKAKIDTVEKLKSKYGDSHKDVKKNALSLLPEGLEIDPNKEFETIEKLYKSYKKLESKPPIHAKHMHQNPWESGNPFLDSSHPDHKKVLSEYLSKIR